MTVAPLQVDRLRAWPDRLRVPPDLGDAAITDGDRGDNAVFVVQGQELTIDKRKVLRIVAQRRSFAHRSRRISKHRNFGGGRSRRTAKHGCPRYGGGALDEITSRKTCSFLIVICHFKFLL